MKAVAACLCAPACAGLRTAGALLSCRIEGEKGPFSITFLADAGKRNGERTAPLQKRGNVKGSLQ